MASTQTSRLLSDLNATGIQSTYPQLYNVLEGLINSVDLVSTDLQTVQSILNPGGIGSVPNDVTNFMVELNHDEVLFTYDVALNALNYELRVGSSWATADYVTTSPALNIPINPLVVGIYTYLIKAIGTNGNYSTNATSVTFTITAPGAIVATTQVVTNNVLFFWDVPTSIFDIDYYNIYKNGVLLGTVHGTFFSYFEISAGTYQYSIVAVDIAGNVGADGITAILTLPSPTDYTLHATVDDDFTGGTKVACKTDLNNFLIAPIDITTTYQVHFTGPGWAGPSAQVAASYPIFIQPNSTPGTYTKIFDFGSIVSSVIVNLFYSTQLVAGAVTVGFTIAVSDDNVTYDAPQAGTSRYAASCRYARVIITFTASDDKGLIYLTSLQADLNVHLEQDGGNVSAVSTDAGGTTVNFNKSFLSVVSITTIVKQTVPRDVIIDFTYSTVNPTSFKILVYDNAGVRQTETVGWQARGILV